MSVKLYGLAVSHPTHAVRAMLAYKGIEYDLTNFPLGPHAVLLRALGFPGRTVPAMKLDGRRVQGSLKISRCLEELKPEPALFPADRRAAVEEAEAWGEREFQPLPRRFFRWGMATQGELRTWVAKNILRTPGPATPVAAASIKPMAMWFARLSRADEDYVREGIAKLPSHLDHIDGLIATGVIGRPDEPTAADFQIASTLAVLRGFEDVAPLLEGRPAAELSWRLFPRKLQGLPRFLPADAVAALPR